jgi:hypothetical protein
MPVFQLARFMVESRKLFARALWHFSSNYQTPLWWQQMSPLEESMLTEYLL